MRHDPDRRRSLGGWLALSLAALLVAPLPLAAQGHSRQHATPSSRTASAPAPSSSHSPGTVSRSSGGQGSGSRATAGRTRPGSSGGGGRTAVTERRPPSHHGSGFRPYYPGYFGHGYFPYWGWSFGYWGYPYWWGGYGYYPPAPYYSYQASSDMGAIDLNVRPKKTEVYLNGQKIGQVKSFDGYPGYLWLDEGTYDLVFFLPGYETLHREVKVFPGVVIDFRERMVPGESRPPEEVLAEVRRERAPQATATAPATGGESAGPAPSAVEPRDVRGEPGRILLSVSPGDASIYLDGRFLGTGDDLARLHAGLMVDPGEHQISAVRPGRDAQELSVDVKAGEEVQLAITLRPSAGG